MTTRTLPVAGEPDEREPGWTNAVCPFCNTVTTYDAAHRQIVSKCVHLVARHVNGTFIFGAA
jgi:hypothetical protein